MSYYWTTLFFALVLIFFIHNAYADPIQADNTNKVEILNPQVQPSTIKVGDTFSITTTLVNNSPNPIYFSRWCEDLFSVVFDNHVMVDHKPSEIACTANSVVTLVKPDENITATIPFFNSVYRATVAGTANATITFQYGTKDAPNSISLSKSFLFTIYDNNTGIKTINEPVLSPLAQFKAGVLSNDIQCEQGLALVIKLEDNSPACVKPQTVQKLVERGWGTILSSITKKINAQDSLSLTTEKTIYKLGEKTPITIKNIGNIKLAFPDGNLGIAVLNASGKFMCCGSTAMITYLSPDENFTYVWGQGTVDYGSQVKAGNYTITVLFGTPDAGMIYNESKLIEIK